VAIINTQDYPGQIFLALEFYPGNTNTPVSGTLMGPGIEAKITGYKLDIMQIYSAQASDRAAVLGRLGGILAKAASGAQAAAPCAAPAGSAGPCVCCHTDPVPASDWKTGLTLVPGAIDAAAEYVPNASTLKSEVYEYKLSGAGPDRVVLSASLQTHADGSRQEVALDASAVRAGSASASMPRLAADGRSLIWVPQRNGLAAVSLYDAAGRRAWSAKSAAAAGQPQVLAMPRMAPGRYLVSAQGRGWAQRAWLDIGKR
jgi:hypothetical protein